MTDLKNYSLDFIERNPSASYRLPLLVHSIAVSHNGYCYALLNDYSIMKINKNGVVTKHNKIQIPNPQDKLLIRLAVDRISSSF
jgi:hypothetical protein